MSAYVGDYRIATTVRKMWNSNAVAGESITRGTNGTISVYKDGGLTQSTTGVTDTEDFDGLTGVHLVAIDTSADGTFYSAGSDFEVVLSASTIDSKAINATLFSFSLENRSALMPTTAGRKLDVSAAGEAGLDWANIGGPTTAQNLSATNIDVDQITASVSGAVGSVTGAVGSVTGAVGSVTGAVGSVTGAVGSVTGAVGSVTAGVTLAASAVQAIWDALTSALTTVGSIGKKLADWTIGTAQTGDSFARIGAAGAGLTNIDLPNQTMDITGSLSGSVGSVTGAVGSLTTNNDKTGYSLLAGQLKLIKNAAFSNFGFLLVASSDHATPLTGATVTPQRSIDGAAFGACANAVTEIGSGFYKINLAAADLNGDIIHLKFTAASADQRGLTVVTSP